MGAGRIWRKALYSKDLGLFNYSENYLSLPIDLADKYCIMRELKVINLGKGIR